MTDTETRYAQIGKEMLSIIYAATMFHQYIFGKHVTVLNDHKPLEAIFKKAAIVSAYETTEDAPEASGVRSGRQPSEGVGQATRRHTIWSVYMLRQSGEFEHVSVTSLIPVSSAK